MIGHVLCHDEELHYTIIEDQKPSGRPRNSYISQLKKDAGINTHVRLKRLAEDHEKWK